jgi:hypothetical protein
MESHFSFSRVHFEHVRAGQTCLLFLFLFPARKILWEAKPREAGLSEYGGGCGDSFSP